MLLFVHLCICLHIFAQLITTAGNTEREKQRSSAASVTWRVGGGNKHSRGSNQHSVAGNQHGGGGSQHSGGSSQDAAGGKQHGGWGSQHGGGANQHSRRK